MKKTILFGVLFLLVLCSFASASLVLQDVTLGGNDQRKSNEGEDYIVYTEKTFTITNNGNATITDIAVSVSGAEARYNVTLTGNAIASLGAGASSIVTVRAKVPEDFDAVDSNGAAKAFQIGTINAVGNVNATASSNLNMQVKDMLRIKDIVVTYGPDNEEDSVDDGDSVSGIKPGDHIKVVVTVENLYDGNDEQDVNIDTDVNVDTDNDIDIDDDSQSSDINPDSEEDFTFEMDVDSSIDEGTYDFDIEVTGEDDNNAMHGEKANIQFEIEKEKEDLQIDSAVFTPASLECTQKSVSLKVVVENQGSKRANSAVLKIVSDELDLTQRATGIDVDEGDKYTKTFQFTLPSNTKPGDYMFDLATYFDSTDYNNEDSNNAETIILTVKQCETTTPTTPEEEEETTTPTTGGIEVQTPPTTGIVTGQPVQETSIFGTQEMYIVVLGVGALIAFALIILAIALLARRK